MEPAEASSDATVIHKLGPEGHLYDPLPTRNSIRTLLLAPGCDEDEIVCYFFPCDLDKDRSIDASSPRPFKSLAFGTASGSGSEDAERQFQLHVDCYVEKRQEPKSISQAAPMKQDQSSRKGKEVARNVENISQILSEATDSADLKSRVENYLEDFNKLADGETPSERRRKVLVKWGLHYFAFIKKNPHGEHEKNRERQAFEAWRAGFAAASLMSNEKQPDLLTDDDWDFLQLARLTFSNGSLHAPHHPFQRFTALSYVWGDPTAPKSILIDGKTRFWVTRNLFDALKTLRRPDGALMFWIDAICINQDDPEEKRWQIGLMRRIYRQAHRVLAYVPQTEDDKNNLNRLVSLILRADRKCREAIESGPIPQEEPNEKDAISSFSIGPNVEFHVMPLKNRGACLEDYDLPAEDDPIWGAWRRFFASPYFRRMWILQEYALAASLDFEFGGGQGSSDGILLAMDAIDRRSRRLNAKYMACDDFELLRKAYLGWIGYKQMVMERVFTRTDIYKTRSLDRGLVKVLPTSMTLEATDPRDKIYGLMGLVSDAEAYMDLVSYHNHDTYVVIYKRFARRLIEKGNFTQILRMACQTSTNAQLPSWTPNWSSPISRNTISQNYAFRAGGDSNPVSSHLSPQNPDQLNTAGYIDSIVTFKTSAFASSSQYGAIQGGPDSLQDLFDNVFTAWEELSAHCDRDRIDFMWDIHECLTMQARKVESMDQATRSDSETKDLENYRTFMARMAQYDLSGERKKCAEDSRYRLRLGDVDEAERDFILKIQSNTANRCFCVLSCPTGDRIGLISKEAEVGDCLAIIKGAAVPYVLREMPEGVVEDRTAYELVGDAYVAELMLGQALQEDDFAWDDIALI
ncbi:uncharacterized protein N0V89_004968 [Didymosphaeria variabile]|uniref:Heterokaryon incompatibility domain-containing protein n=1 Tax=Didymosphaeria variabile TaxID=1932322 RepID=A0A9W9CA16_9PLEO|nr:uncharacterized protein N0V89_004968 [Didymosphaeria variabile]KAJ4353241.1 hypothetical protein N0V89_004968 [Didymosphaeria variabile]